MGVIDFGEKMWHYIAMFRDDCYENEGLWVLQKDENSLDDFSWTYQRHWNEFVALTQNRSEGMMNHRYEWTVKKITQPKSHDDGMKVSCSRATCYHKVFCYFSQIFPNHCWPIPLYFLTRLSRVTYAWSIIWPFEWIHRYLII